jgi:hypothetical protein
MKDSPGDQPAVIAVLCAFVRDRAPSIPGRRGGIPQPPPTDIQAVLTVVGSRNTANDGHTTVVDLNHTQLASAQLVDASFRGANLFGANLTAAHLFGANLTGAFWPADAAVPKGWVRDTRSGRLKRSRT